MHETTIYNLLADNFIQYNTKFVKRHVAVVLPNIHQSKNTDRLNNKPFLIWLLTTPPHLKYVATLHCNLLLMACFMTLMFHTVVWKHVMCGVIVNCNNLFTANLLQNFQVNFFLKIG